MPLHSITVDNFKGIGAHTEIPIKPITVFFGANSSGKSSCIHACAALSQTVKLPNSRRPLVLDDEYADVHLGRFTDLVHTRDYRTPIKLGFALPSGPYFTIGKEEKKISVTPRNGPCRVELTYTSQRTQEVRLDSATYEFPDELLSVKRRGAKFTISSKASGLSAPVAPQDAFFFYPVLQSPKKPESSLFFHLCMETIQKRVRDELGRTLYLGPFRQAPLRRYPTRGAAPTEVGAMGEAAVTLLANERMQSRRRPHHSQIIEWLTEMKLAVNLNVVRIGQSDLFDINVALTDGVTLPLADLGYGLSQVLPVLVQCSFAPRNATLLFEQPELHLHTLAARGLTRALIDTAKDKGCHVVVETHSREIIGQLQRDLRANRLKLDQLAVYKVRRVKGQTQVHPVQIDANDYDIYDDWERGVTMT